MSGSELRSGRNLEFGVDVSQVKLDGLEAHREPFGGLPWARTASCRRSLRAARDRFQVALCSPRSSDHAAVKPRASRSSTPPRPAWRAGGQRQEGAARRPFARPSSRRCKVGQESSQVITPGPGRQRLEQRPLGTHLMDRAGAQPQGAGSQQPVFPQR